MKKLLIPGGMLILGVVVGIFASAVIQRYGERAVAVANIYAAGEALRSNDLVGAMLHASSIVSHAPDAYDGYQMMGDVYSKQGYDAGAKDMYELSLKKLSSGGEGAMLVETGVTSESVARELLQRKIGEFR